MSAFLGKSGNHLRLMSFSEFVKVFGCRPLMDSAASAGGRRTKTSKGGNRDGGTCEDAPHYGDLSAAE
jgi:hypothetical protein